MTKRVKKLKFQAQVIHSAQWNRNHLNGILNDARSKRILVIGDLGIDRYTIGSVERISPEAPVPIVLVQEEKHKLGLAANVADNIKALGAEPFLVGVVGKDRRAEDFRDLLKASQIKATYLITDPSRGTALKERIVSDRQQIVRIDYESSHPVSIATEKKILSKFKALIRSVDGVIVEDYAKGILTASLIQSVFSLCRKFNKPVVVDPNLKTPLSHYTGADLLTPNRPEAEQLSGVLIHDDESLAEAGFKLLKLTKAKFIIITRGKEGMAVFTQKSSRIQLIPTYAREVYDVSGAGDTVIAVLMLALTAGASIEEAAVLGNIAAGIEVGKRGTATVTPNEIRLALEYFEALQI